MTANLKNLNPTAAGASFPELPPLCDVLSDLSEKSRLIQYIADVASNGADAEHLSADDLSALAGVLRHISDLASDLSNETARLSVSVAQDHLRARPEAA